MKKLLLLAVAGVGYVLGSRAGRERYEQIMGTVNKVKNDPRVQEKTQQAVDIAKDKAPVVQEKLAGAAGAATSKVKSASSSDPADKLNPESTIFQENSGPQGVLP